MFYLHPTTHHLAPNSSIPRTRSLLQYPSAFINHLVCACPLPEPLQRLWVGDARIGLDVETRKNLLDCHLDPATKKLDLINIKDRKVNGYSLLAVARLGHTSATLLHDAWDMSWTQLGLDLGLDACA